MPKGTNLPGVAAFNETVVLDAVRRSESGLSRVELAAATGLTAQTVTNVARRLLAQGLIREAGKLSDGPGKPRTILRLRPSGAYAAGLHLDPTVITCVVLDLAGGIVEHVRRAAPADGDAEATVRAAADAVREVLDRSGADERRVIGLGVAAPGPIDAVSGVVVRPPLAPGWNGLRLRDALTEATGLPSLLAKDVTAAAVAERWHDGTDASKDYVFVYYGTGVGVGLVLDGQVYTGSTQNAGDVGHSIVDPGGALCACGRRGCFGESVRPYRLVMQALWAGVLTPPRGRAVTAGEDLDLGVEVTDELFTRLVAAADDGDSRAGDILSQSIRNSAAFVSNLAALLDIDRVVYGGPSWGRVRGRYLAELPRRLAEIDMAVLTHPVAVEGTSVGEDVAAVGAACLVLDATYSPRVGVR